MQRDLLADVGRRLVGRDPELDERAARRGRRGDRASVAPAEELRDRVLPRSSGAALAAPAARRTDLEEVARRLHRLFVESERDLADLGGTRADGRSIQVSESERLKTPFTKDTCSDSDGPPASARFFRGRAGACSARRGRSRRTCT